MPTGRCSDDGCTKVKADVYVQDTAWSVEGLCTIPPSTPLRVGNLVAVSHGVINVIIGSTRLEARGSPGSARRIEGFEVFLACAHGRKREIGPYSACQIC